MTAINTNVGALNARLYTLGANKDQQQAMERLSSGRRVNSAADDAAGLAVAGKMESQLRGINMAIRNNQDGVGLIQTAESGLNEIRNMVLRIRELSVQMANGIYENTPDRANAQLEVTALLEQVDLIADNTRFNDIALLDGTFSGVAIQAGNTHCRDNFTYFCRSWAIRPINKWCLDRDPIQCHHSDWNNGHCASNDL